MQFSIIKNLNINKLWRWRVEIFPDVYWLELHIVQIKSWEETEVTVKDVSGVQAQLLAEICFLFVLEVLHTRKLRFELVCISTESVTGGSDSGG